MTLEQLIAELRNNVLNDRSSRTDESANDYLWSDETLVTYIDEAQRRLARKGLVIRDGSTAAVCEVTLVTGQKQYTLHDSVLSVISARYDDREVDMQRVGRTIFNVSRPANEIYDASSFVGLPDGAPMAYATDEEVVSNENDAVQTVTLRVYPKPTATENGKKLYLRVIRMPIERLNLKLKKHQRPEVPEDFHIDMLDWAAYLALRIQDQDQGNAGAGDRFRQSFEAMVLDARKTTLRKLFAPTGWGFGQAGWSW